MAFTPNQERALKLMEEFASGSNASDVRLKTTARISGAFPLPSEFMSSNPMTPLMFHKRPFDDTILNQNDSLLKRRRTENRRSTGDCNDSLNDSITLASPWETRKMKGDLIQAKAEISTLEAQCNKLLSLREEDLLLYKQDKKLLKQTIENNKQTICDFEAKLKKMRKRELELKEELDRKNKETLMDMNGLADKNAILLEDNRNLKSRISEMELKTGEITRDLNSTKTELTSALEELKMTREQVTKLQTHLAELKVSARQHELDKAALITAQRKINELENDAKNYSETAALLKEQQSKLIRMSELERQLSHLKTENLGLRDARNKILKLNEVVDDLKGKVTDLEVSESLLKSTKVELGLAVHELTEYKSLCRCVVGEGAGHVELTNYIREMQQSRLLNHSDLSTLQAKLKTAEDNYQCIVANCENLKTEVAKLKAESELHTNTLRRLKKQFTITTWERDELRKMLDTLQKETTVACSDTKVENMEKLIEGYRQRVDIMEQEMQKTFAAGTSPVGTKTSGDSAAALENLRKKNAELMQRIEKLEYELEHRNLKGDFDTRNTKILHFKINPTDVAVQEREDALDKAQTEVNILREKIRLLQEAQNTSQLCNITQIATDKAQETHSKELDELREKVKSQELQNQRLLEAFKTTSREFREAVNSLLGYNVSSIQNKKLFKLTSMYADSPEHHLLFQMLPEGGMELLETEMSRNVIDLIQLHLCQNHSIPMFLSALTMELFSNRSIQSQSTIVLP